MYGELVADARRSRRLTQLQLAELSGIEQANISAIERGHRMPSAATLHRLLDACGYALAATAGTRVIRCRPPEDDPVLAQLLEGPSELDEPPVVTPATPMRERVRVLMSVLRAAEAQLRAR
jgi:transcriptional regulator with XRE-family HTH domain